METVKMTKSGQPPKYVDPKDVSFWQSRGWRKASDEDEEKENDS